MASFKIHEDISNLNQNKNKICNNKIIKGNVLKNNEITKLPIKRVPLRSANIINDGKKNTAIIKTSSIQKSIQNVKPEIKIERTENPISQQSDKKENSFDSEQLLEYLNEKITESKHSFSSEYNQEQFYFPKDYYYLTQTEYHDNIYKYLINLERRLKQPNPEYMPKQFDLNQKMRSILIDWLSQICEEYNMQPQTLHLTVQYIDCFLSRMSVVKSKFQLVGTAAMMLAAKYEEIYPPDTKEWAYLTADSFTVKQLLRMEQLILKVIQFEIARPTAFNFISHICFVCDLPKKYMLLAMYLSELALLEGSDYLSYLPSQLASSSLALARFTLNETEPWPSNLAVTSGYNVEELSVLMQKQNKTFQDSPTKTQQAIQEKYRSRKYGKVSLCKPRTLDLYMEE